MKNKKILLITEGLASGGAERQICGLASLLTVKGYSCRLITYSDTHFYESWLRAHNVDYEFVPSLQKKRTRVFRLVRYLRTYNPDVLISYLPSVNMTCCLARLFYRCFLIVSERNNNTYILKRDKVLFNLYRLANVIVPNSNCQGRFIKENFPFLSLKVYPIINFVDLTHFTPKANKTENEIIKIVTTARYTEQKNCLVYLNAVKKIKDMGIQVHFDWYGNKNYDPVYYSIVEKMAKEIGVIGIVTLHDSCKNVVEIYQDADIFMLPSLYEGYPNSIVEAMACELPILCSRVFENPDIVRDEENGYLFNPNKVEDMVRAIVRMVQIGPKRRREMGVKNRLKCIENNSEDVFVDEYVKIIEDE